MKIVCGLGNPGAKYQQTPHNVGFVICDRVADAIGATFTQTKFHAHVAQGRHDAQPVLLLKPQTFMNRAGKSVAPAMNFYKAAPDDLLVVHDDADLEPGRLRLKRGGGTAGHKGLNSLRDHLGHADFARLRYGVGRPADARIDLSDHVLSAFAPEEEKIHEEQTALAARAVLCWIAEGIEAAMNEFNRPA